PGNLVMIDIARITVVGSLSLKSDKIIAGAGRPETTNERPPAKAGIVAEYYTVLGLIQKLGRSKHIGHGRFLLKAARRARRTGPFATAKHGSYNALLHLHLVLR